MPVILATCSMNTLLQLVRKASFTFASAFSCTGSEALAVRNGGAGLIVLALGDPQLLECAQRGQDGSTNAHRALALRGCRNLDLHDERCQGDELLGHALAKVCKLLELLDSVLINTAATLSPVM